MCEMCCPSCGKEIAALEEGDRICEGCGYEYRFEQGVINFTPAENFYWGEISREAMIRVNQKAEQTSWRKAILEDVLGSKKENMVSYLLGDNRIAGLFHFYDPEMSDTVADLGSGWGPISFGLSRYYDTVYSIDGVAERLRFQAIRAQQDGVKNLKIMKGSMLKLPLRDHSMSAVVVNGLLEWIGLSDTKTDPHELQTLFLNEVYRVLKPGGKIYIGIDNRTGIQFFFGNLDHSGLRYTSLVPRWLANHMVRAKSRIKKRFFTGADQSYRTLTYTSWGYRKLLNQIGFCQPQVYWAWPGYNQPEASGTLDGESIRHYLRELNHPWNSRLKQLLIKTAGRLPCAVLGFLIQFFSPEFLIVANKEKQNGGIEDALLNSNRAERFLRTTLESDKALKSSYLLFQNGQKYEKELIIPPKRVRKEG